MKSDTIQKHRHAIHDHS